MGIYCFLCQHTFICINCINNNSVKCVEIDGFLEYCKTCKEPTNPTFANYIAISNKYEERQNVLDWKKNNIKQASECCLATCEVKTISGNYKCMGCGELY